MERTRYATRGIPSKPIAGGRKPPAWLNPLEEPRPNLIGLYICTRFSRAMIGLAPLRWEALMQ